MNAPRIIFFGSSEFSLPALEALMSSGFKPLLVISMPDALVGRKQVLTPSPVKVKAEALGLSVFTPQTLKSEQALRELASYRPEVGVLAAYGKIIPKPVLDVFPKGILNIHPSLLPLWRGPTPVQTALLHGDKETGATIILLDEEIDHGPILSQKKLEIQAHEAHPELHERLARFGAVLLLETLPKWLEGSIAPVPQEHGKATLCRKFTREDGRIHWAETAEAIDRQIRALNPEPGTWTRWQIANNQWQVVKILQLSLFSNSRELENKKSGEVFGANEKLVVKCADRALVLEIVQPEGKKPMKGEDFLRGHQEIAGTTLS